MATGNGTPVFETVGGDASAATATFTAAGSGASTTQTLAQIGAAAVAAGTVAATANAAATAAGATAASANTTANSASVNASTALSTSQAASAGVTAVAGKVADLVPLKAGDFFLPEGVTTDENLAAPMAAMQLQASASFAGIAENLIVVNPGILGREFKGVGAALTESAASQLMLLTPAARTAFLTDVFGDKKWNHIRLCAGPSDYRTGSVYTYCDAGPVIDPGLSTFDLGRDKEAIIPIAQEILRINPSVQFFIAPWSPPPGVKDSYNIVNGNINPTPANLTWLAQYFVKMFWEFNKYGIRLAFVQPQNEPQVNGSGYPCCGWTGEQLATFIGTYLGPAFVDAGIDMPIAAVGGTNYADEDNRRAIVLADPTAAKYATLGDTHAYGGDVADVTQNLARAFPNVEWMMSEYTLSKSNSPWFNIGYMCNFLIGCVRAGCTRVVMWNLMLNPDGGPWQQGDSSGYNGTTTLNADKSITYQADYWLLSMIMRYWQPGARLCYSTCNSVGTANPYTLQTSAFLNPDGSRFMFVWNPTSSAITGTVLDAVTNTGFPITLDAGEVAVMTWGPKQLAATPGTFTAPAAPVLATPTYTPFGQPYVNISWPTNTGNTVVAAFNIYDANADSVPLLTVSGQAISFTDTTLTTGSSRSYYAKAVNAAGEGPASNTVSATAIAVKAASTHYANVPSSTTNNLVSTVKNLDNSSGVLSGFIQFTPSSPITVPGIGSKLCLLFGDMDDADNSEKTFGLYWNIYNQLALGVYDSSGTFAQVWGPCVDIGSMTTAGLYVGFALNTTDVAITDYLGKSVPAKSAQFYVSYDGGTTIYPLGDAVAVTATSLRTVATGSTEQIACFCDGLSGYAYKAALYSGSAPASAAVNVDFTAQSSGATSFQDAAGNTWSIAAPATIV